MARRIVREEGIFCGGSSGTAVEGALSYARKNPLTADSLMVVLLPDAGEIYLSKMYSDEWMRQNQFLGSKARVEDVLAAKKRKLPQLLTVESASSVREAIEQKHYAEAEQEIVRVAKALEDESALIESAAKMLEERAH